MKTSTDFEILYKTLSNTELLEILENQHSYQSLAVDAAKIEVENRQLTTEQIVDAKGELLAKKFQKEQREVREAAIKNKVKDAGNFLFDSLNPIHNKTLSADKLIQSITLVFFGLLLYQLISERRLLSLILRDLPRFDFTSFLYLFSLSLSAMSVFLFWKRKTIGWVIISILMTYALIAAFWGLWQNLRTSSSGSIRLTLVFPRTSSLTYIIQLCFFGGTLWVLCNPKIREVFRVSKQTMIAIIVATAVIALLMSTATS